jgi:hypothetical protein
MQPNNQNTDEPIIEREKKIECSNSTRSWGWNAAESCNTKVNNIYIERITLKTQSVQNNQKIIRVWCFTLYGNFMDRNKKNNFFWNMCFSFGPYRVTHQTDRLKFILVLFYRCSFHLVPKVSINSFSTYKCNTLVKIKSWLPFKVEKNKCSQLRIKIGTIECELEHKSIHTH